jgi:hypothetical protein
MFLFTNGSDYCVKGRITADDEVERIWKEAVTI